MDDGVVSGSVVGRAPAPLQSRKGTEASRSTVGKVVLEKGQEPERVPKNDLGISIPFTLEAGLERLLSSSVNCKCVAPSSLLELWRKQQRMGLQDYGDDDDNEEEEPPFQSLAGSKRRRRKSSSVDNKWVTAGIVVSRTATSLVLAASWEGDAVEVTLEGTAAQIPLPKSACVLLSEPFISRAKGGNVALRVERANQLVVLGVSNCVGFCVERTSAVSKVCNRLLNCQRGTKCRMHEEMMYHKTQVFCCLSFLIFVLNEKTSLLGWS
jgi:hypothetical protein